MNPIVHAELSWLLSQALPERRDRALCTVAGLVPDLDGLSLLGGVDAYGTYHHLLTHGALAGGAMTLVAMAAGQQRLRAGLFAAAAFHLHLVCDLAGSGPGWPVFYWWPWSRREWFWDWQWELVSWQNGAIGLVATLVCLGMALVAGRTPLELVWRRADAAVTSALQKRFGAA